MTTPTPAPTPEAIEYTPPVVDIQLFYSAGRLGLGVSALESRKEMDRAIAAITAQAKGEALAPILALHQPEKRWTAPDYTGSFDTREEAAELDESYDGPNVDYFEICAHCGSIERDWAEDHAEEWNYKLAMWPCKTAAAVLP